MTTTLANALQDPKYQEVYAEEGFVIDVMETICDWMEQRGVSRAELARKLGTSRANVTQVLNGRNVNLRTLASVVHALEGVPRFAIQPRGAALSCRPTGHPYLWPVDGSSQWQHPTQAQREEAYVLPTEVRTGEKRTVCGRA